MSAAHLLRHFLHAVRRLNLLIFRKRRLFYLKRIRRFRRNIFFRGRYRFFRVFRFRRRHRLPYGIAGAFDPLFRPPDFCPGGAFHPHAAAVVKIGFGAVSRLNHYRAKRLSVQHKRCCPCQLAVYRPLLLVNAEFMFTQVYFLTVVVRFYLFDVAVFVAQYGCTVLFAVNQRHFYLFAAFVDIRF